MNNLRPQKLKDLIGQQDIKNILEISIDSAIKRKDVLSYLHCIFIGWVEGGHFISMAFMDHV